MKEPGRVSEVGTLTNTKGDEMFTVMDYLFQAKFKSLQVGFQI